jgi:2-polyprenyl-3-methyl-5-hydroxy-6-metoxy-1,4-benzoquinol methylase
MAAERPHPVVHLQLRTANLPRACSFYTRLLGWDAERRRSARPSRSRRGRGRVRILLRVPKGPLSRIREVLPSSRGSDYPSAWPDWHRRRIAAERCFVPWVSQVLPLEGKTVLEYGSGHGAVSAAFAPGTARYIGLDVDADSVATARRILTEGGIEAELVAAPADRILGELAAFRGEIDVLLCYAVLEHMSVDERLALLGSAREVVRPGGVVVVIETPNRLTPWDYHTSQLPFLNQLPDALALRYAERAPRTEYVDALRADPDEAFVRWGRGMSFHELELAFGDLTSHVAASSWDPLLLPEREVHREELALQRVLDKARPDLPGAFSRYWLDVVLTVDPLDAPRRFLHPWPLRTSGSVDAVYEEWETVGLGPSGVLSVALPSPSSRVVVGLDSPDEDRLVTIRAAGGEELALPVTSPGGYGVYADAVFAAPSDAFEVRLDRPGQVSFVLYER